MSLLRRLLDWWRYERPSNWDWDSAAYVAKIEFYTVDTTATAALTGETSVAGTARFVPSELSNVRTTSGNLSEQG